MTNERDRWVLENIGCDNLNISCTNIENEACHMLQKYLPKLCQRQEGLEQEQQFYYYVTLWTVVVPVVFAMITVIGIFGNALVIYVVFTAPRLRTPTHMFLVNLAVSDITFLAICVPFQAYKYAATGWHFGDVWCQVIQYLLYVTLYVTVWTLVCIAAIRYVVLVHGQSAACRRIVERPLPICVILWLVMLIVHVPTLLVHRVNQYGGDEEGGKEVDGGEYLYCGIEHNSTKQVFLALFVCAYVLPLCLICVLYLLVIRHLHQANKTQALRSSTTSISSRRNHTVRVTKVTVVIVLVFSASWLPLHVHSLISYYGHVPVNRYYEVFRIVWHCMAYSNSLANPFIYNFACSDFRKAFRYVLCCHRLRKVGRQRTRSVNRDTERQQDF